VLRPDTFQTGRRYRVLYLLSVDAGDNLQFSNPMAEARRLGFHNRNDLICAYATFSQTSWYADNPLNARMRQESYFVHDVVPLIERRYPVIPLPVGRLLVGFSKSGWGAFTLLLRHPDLFGKAAAWDAPLDENGPSQVAIFPGEIRHNGEPAALPD
jgi:S-formylglutathione hydrolase FrmB